MATLLRKALILDGQSKLHGKKRDVLIDQDRITAIGVDLKSPRAKIISAPGLTLSTGWIDLRAHFRDPGQEYKEDVASGIQAARRGGFRKVVLMPSSFPPSDNKSAMDYLRTRSAGGVELLPVGALSRKMEGLAMSDMFDMHQAGAIAFGDDKQPNSTELVVRALEYMQSFGGLLYSFPFDPGVNPGGLMHEGKVSVSLGMKGLSSLSEEIRLARDLDLLRYCGGRMHVSLISTSRSVDLIRKAKKEGLQVTSAVAAHQLSFLDEDLVGFDANHKVLPPYRSLSDRKALIAGLKDGTIDAICSDHCPEDPEHKEVEFDQAAFGISSIETAFCTALEALSEHLDIEAIVGLFTTGPARVLGISSPTIAEGNASQFTVFSSEENTTFSTDSWKSRSQNSPFFGRTLRGKVYA